MYSLIIREDTIRIPAEYIRAGRKLEEHIDELAHDAFECRFDENEDFTLLTFDHEAVGLRLRTRRHLLPRCSPS